MVTTQLIATFVASSLDTARMEQTEKHCDYLITVIQAIMSSNNKGNYLKLIDLLAIDDPIVRE